MTDKRVKIDMRAVNLIDDWISPEIPLSKPIRCSKLSIKRDDISPMRKKRSKHTTKEYSTKQLGRIANPSML